MKTVTEHIRNHVMDIAGVPVGRTNIPSLPKLQKTEWSKRFEVLMRNRLITGAIRYGLLNEPGKPSYNLVVDMINRLGKYLDTGNDEILVDVANLAMMEFEEGHHPNKHFKSIDDGKHTKKVNI